MKFQPSLYSRVVVSSLVLALSGFFDCGAILAQDISGGSSMMTASADVEAKLGKGIFTPAPNRVHAVKPVEKRILVSSVRSAHTTQRPTTTTGTRPETGSR